jgi:hypothetical protein
VRIYDIDLIFMGKGIKNGIIRWCRRKMYVAENKYLSLFIARANFLFARERERERLNGITVNNEIIAICIHIHHFLNINPLT